MLFDVLSLGLSMRSLAGILGEGLDYFRLIEAVDVALGTRRGVVS